jgi:hypothetical protein
MSNTVVDTLIERARNMPAPEDGEIIPDIGRSKGPAQPPRPPRPVEPLPKPAEIITPAGTKYRFVIPAEGTEGLQAWESDSLEDLSGKLFKSLQHANVYIQRQKRQLKELHGLLRSITAYLESLARLRGAQADAELQELMKIIEQRQSV